MRTTCSGSRGLLRLAAGNCAGWRLDRTVSRNLGESLRPQSPCSAATCWALLVRESLTPLCVRAWMRDSRGWSSIATGRPVVRLGQDQVFTTEPSSPRLAAVSQRGGWMFATP